jgi:uncharacterized protein YkwD
MPKHPLLVVALTLTAVLCFLGVASTDADDNTADIAAFTQEMQARLVAAHNDLRDEVGVSPLNWSGAVAAHARERADTIKRQDCTLQHPQDEIYGENLVWSSRRSLSPEQVVAVWGAESANYDYTGNQCARNEVCGHYTQVVWRITTTVGCASARCDKGEVWVCNYDPPGNWVGEKPY